MNPDDFLARRSILVEPRGGSEVGWTGAGIFMRSRSEAPSRSTCRATNHDRARFPTLRLVPGPGTRLDWDTRAGAATGGPAPPSYTHDLLAHGAA